MKQIAFIERWQRVLDFFQSIDWKTVKEYA